MSLPSQRLRELLGADPRLIDEPAIGRLVGQTEESDLDFKATLYAAGEDGKAELAKDVAAFANLLGGLLVLGVEEEDGRGKQLVPLEVTETDEQRIRTIVTERVVPYLAMEIVRVESTDQPGRGYLLISVPAGVEAPHAARKGESLRYPIRDGRQTRYMAEAEIAANYRRRFVTLADRLDSVTAAYGGGISRLPADQDQPTPWLSLTLVPVQGGSSQLDLNRRQAVQQDFLATARGTCPYSSFHQSFRARVGVRQVRMTDSLDGNATPHRAFAALHADGTAFVAAAVSRWYPSGLMTPDASRYAMTRDRFTWELLAMMDIAVAHSVARGSSGDAIAQVDFLWLPPLHTAAVTVVTRDNAIPPPGGWPTIDRMLEGARYTVPLEPLARSGTELVAACYQPLAELEATFGEPEPTYVRADGSFVRAPMGAWTDGLRPWAEARGVEFR